MKHKYLNAYFIMKRTIKLTSILLAATFLFSSCATIFTKSTYPLTINSNPSGADITIIDKKGKIVYQGQSPAVAKLKSSAGFFSKAEYSVKLSSPGYDDHIVTVGADIEGWYFGNILLGGIIGMLIVDPATGAMWTLDTSDINATLRKSATSQTPTLEIMDINTISDDMKDRLVRVN